MRKDISATSSSATSSSGPLSLEKISSDVLLDIVSWLDPLSILNLSWTCKALEASVGCDNFLWRRAFRNISVEYCLAPHSYPPLSINDLKRISTRPDRLFKAIRDPKRPLHATMRRYTLNYGGSLVDRNVTITPNTNELMPYLLPGGRWLLSGIIDHDNASTHLFCWDLASCIDNSPLQPAAALVWEGMEPVNSEAWIDTQLHESKVVRLAFAFNICKLNTTVYEIVSLSWGAETTAPLLERVAQFEMQISDFDSYEIEGDYMVFSTPSAFIFWNWKDNLVGTLKKPEKQDWGSSFTLIPPHLFIFPEEMREVLVLEIPQLHLAGSKKSFQPISPTSWISHRLLDEIPQLEGSCIFVLESWKPPSWRSGIVVLMIQRPYDAGWNLFYVLSLRGAAPPVYWLQQNMWIMTSYRDYDCALLASGPVKGMIKIDHYSPWDIIDDQLTSYYFPFTEDGIFAQPTERALVKPWDHEQGSMGPLCLVSGTALLREEADFETDSYNRGIEVWYFDSEYPENMAPVV
ncbi:hypothetical protein DL93DRAFT_2227767 [Clavulina sp. PMI_390]|nr:hypothetical protein DL93DRAFT_2227767 [Clavulina sp. PMI_390]